MELSTFFLTHLQYILYLHGKCLTQIKNIYSILNSLLRIAIVQTYSAGSIPHKLLESQYELLMIAVWDDEI